MRKTVSLMLIMVLGIALAACGAGNNGNANGGNNGGAEPANAQASGGTNGGNAANNGAGNAANAEAGGEVTVTHPLGTATVKKNPEKVVVFDYGTLDTLDTLGVEVAAVPQANLPAYLSKFADESKYQNAGTLFEPDFEALHRLKPDVIFIGGRTAEAYAELEKIAPTIQVTVDNANYMPSFKGNVEMLAGIFGLESKVADELAAIDAAIADLNGRAANAGKSLVVLTTGGKVSAFGSGSRFGIVHDVFGFAQADEAIVTEGSHGQSVTFEYIVEKNPDVLFVIDRDAVAGDENAKPAKEVIENDLVKNTNAYKNGKIVYLDPGYWYLSGGGLTSTDEMIKEAAQAVE